jgi:PAS domain S-box-containing protein
MPAPFIKSKTRFKTLSLKTLSLKTQLKTQWQKIPVIYQGTFALLIPLACTFFSVVAAGVMRQSALESAKYVDRTYEVIQTNQKVLTSLLNAETGVRGYLLTGENRFLNPYKVAESSLPTSLEQLQNLVKDRPAQLQKAKEISQRADAIAKLLGRGTQIKPDRGGNVIVSPLIANLVAEGKRNMDRIRIEIQQFEDTEQQLLAIRQQKLETQREYGVIVGWSSLLLSGFATAIAAVIFSGVARDLIKRERYLRASKNLTQAIVGNIADSVVILDLDNQIESFNLAAERIFGYRNEEVAGQDWQILLPEIDSPDLDWGLDSKPQYPMQTIGHHKDGTNFQVEISISDISFERQRLLIIRDITERQQTAAKLQARADQLVHLNHSLNYTNQALAERNRELDQFAYVASHDLKAPLRAIANLSEWIEEDLEDKIPTENRRHMQLMRDRVVRMEALLNGLLEYSRVGQIPSQIELVDIGKLVEEVIETLAPPQTFTIEIAPMPETQARKMLLKQVFANLIDNAVKYHPTESGKITISAKDLGDRYEFSVKDNGKGIDPIFHHKIYLVFQTLESRDIKESTGIGLAIVKKIVESEGGTISLDSEAGNGADFRFTWLKSPIRQNQELEQSPIFSSVSDHS